MIMVMSQNKCVGIPKMRKFILYVSFLLLSSCVGTNQYQTDYALGVTADNHSVLHVNRTNSVLGSAIAAPVNVNGVLIGQIGPGGYIRTKIPTGKVSVYSTTNNVTFDAQRNSEYYVEVDFLPRMWVNSPDIGVSLVKVVPPK
jgi:hypothetical protein